MVTADKKTDEHGSYDDDKDIKGAGSPDWLGLASFIKYVSNIIMLFIKFVETYSSVAFPK
jgi:hypothetical protein